MISRKNTLFRYKGLCYAKIHMLRLISGKNKKKKKQKQKKKKKPENICLVTGAPRDKMHYLTIFFRHLVWWKVSTYRNMKSLGPITKKIQIIVDHHLKWHWTTSTSSPDFFQKKNWDFYTIRGVHLCSNCMLNLTCNFYLISKICEFFFAAAIFKSLLLKMATTVMTVEFGTIHHYSSQEENSEACLRSSLNRYKNWLNIM